MKKYLSTLCLSCTFLLSDQIDPSNIDPLKKGINAATFSDIKRAVNFTKTLSPYDTYIRSTTKDGIQYHVVYVLNIDKLDLEQTLSDIRTIVPTSFITSDRSINRFYLESKQKKENSKNSISKLNISSIFDKAKKHYKEKNYTEAIKILSQLSSKYPNNTTINFYLGRSYFQIKDYEQATAPYERILILEPNHQRVRLELAQTYMMLNLNEDAIKNFTTVLNDPKTPKNVRENIEKRIEYIKNKVKKNFLFGSISFGITLDNNVLSQSGYVESPDIDVQLDYLESPIHKDTIYTKNITLNHLYKYNENYSIINSITYTNQSYKNDNKRLNNRETYDSLDYQYHDKLETDVQSYSLKLSNTKGNSNLIYMIDASFIDVASEDYMKTYGLGVMYQKRFFTQNTFFTMLKYYDKSYSQIEDKNKDSRNIQALVGNNINTTDKNNISLLYIFTKEDIKNPTILVDTNVPGKQTHNLIVENKYKVDKKLTLNSSISYGKLFEDSIATGFINKRSDDTLTYLIGLNYLIYKNLTISSSYKYITNHSSVNLREYDKELIDFNLKYSF